MNQEPTPPVPSFTIDLSPLPDEQRFYLEEMLARLRVDPARLRETARKPHEVGTYEARPSSTSCWIWEVWDVTSEAPCNHFPIIVVNTKGAAEDFHETMAKRIAETLNRRDYAAEDIAWRHKVEINDAFLDRVRRGSLTRSERNAVAAILETLR